MSTEKDSKTEAAENNSWQHPLLIDLVLETLVKVVPRSSLPVCRLICRKWNSLFLRRFRSEFSVKLNEWKSTEKFVSLLENCNEIPYSRFHISRLPMNDEWVERVFEACGHQMTRLSLELTKDEINICEFRELLTLRAPNLEELFIDNHDGLPEEVTNHGKLFPSWCHHHDNADDNDNQSSPPTSFSLPALCRKLKKIFLRFSSGKKFHLNFLTDLFRESPNLEEIIFRRFTDHTSCSSFASSTTSDTKKLLIALVQGGACRSWSHLRILNLGQVENECLENLVGLKDHEIHLKSFSFEYFVADVEGQTFEDFLLSQCDHLEQLTMNECYGPQDIVVTFPTMQKLRHLSITAFDKSQVVPRQPISYAFTFPALQSLTVYGWQDKIPFNQFFSDTHNQTPLESLTSLQPPYRMNNVQLFQRLQKIFPNVTSLDITSPSNNILTQIWSSWPCLQVLEVFLDWNNVNVDTAFTGLSTSQCDQMRQENSFLNQDMMCSQINDENTGNSICNLKDLKRFVCEIYEPWRDGQEEPEDSTCLPSDIAGYGAFYKMCQLQHIFIARSDMSRECVQNISKQLPLYTHVEIRGPRRQKLI